MAEQKRDLKHEIQRLPRYVPIQMGDLNWPVGNQDLSRFREFSYLPLSGTVIMDAWQPMNWQDEVRNRLTSNTHDIHPKHIPENREPTVAAQEHWESVSFEVYTRAGVESLVDDFSSDLKKQMIDQLGELFEKVVLPNIMDGENGIVAKVRQALESKYEDRLNDLAHQVRALTERLEKVEAKMPS